MLAQNDAINKASVVDAVVFVLLLFPLLLFSSSHWFLWDLILGPKAIKLGNNILALVSQED